MAIRNILKDGEDTLLKKCREVTVFDKRLGQLIDDMTETMHQANGVGLAAPQVGILKRVVVVDVGEGVVELVNPKVIAFSGEQAGPEGCLSFPGQYGLVKRPMHVEVKAQDRNGKEIRVKGSELLARAFCHEIDHLDGVLFKTRATRMLRDEELK